MTGRLRLSDHMPVLDPDAIARLTNPSDPNRAALAAGREVLLQWKRLVGLRVSFGIETTLAGIGPLQRMREARMAGYAIWV